MYDDLIKWDQLGWVPHSVVSGGGSTVLPALLLVWRGVRRAPSFRDSPWRMKCALIENGVLLGALVASEISYCPFLVFVVPAPMRDFLAETLGGWSTNSF